MEIKKVSIKQEAAHLQDVKGMSVNLGNGEKVQIKDVAIEQKAETLRGVTGMEFKATGNQAAELENIYQLTQKTTPLGVVEWDIPCGILVCSMHGYTSFRPWGLQNAVPCRVDTEIPQANPESWACGLFAARARKDPAGDAGRGDRRDQCPAGSCPRGDGDSSEVRGFGRDRKAEGTVGLCPAQEVRLARQGVLERERRLVARIFRLDRRHRRKKNPCLRQIPARTGFRSSEACAGVVPRACPWGSILNAR